MASNYLCWGSLWGVPCSFQTDGKLKSHHVTSGLTALRCSQNQFLSTTAKALRDLASASGPASELTSPRGPPSTSGSSAGLGRARLLPGCPPSSTWLTPVCSQDSAQGRAPPERTLSHASPSGSEWGAPPSLLKSCRPLWRDVSACGLLFRAGTEANTSAVSLAPTGPGSVHSGD